MKGMRPATMERIERCQASSQVQADKRQAVCRFAHAVARCDPTGSSVKIATFDSTGGSGGTPLRTTVAESFITITEEQPCYLNRPTSMPIEVTAGPPEPPDMQAVLPDAPPPESKPSWKLLDLLLVLPKKGPGISLRLAMNPDDARPLVLEEATRLEAERCVHVGELVRKSPENTVYESAVARQCQLREERKRLAASLAGVEGEVDGAHRRAA